MIKELLIMHDQLIWAGGYHQQSLVYHLFHQKTERLLKIFNLPNTSDMVGLIFGVPLSQFIDINNPCSVENCPLKAKEMMYLYLDTVRSGCMQPYREYQHLWTMNERVEAVFDNLVMVGDTGFPISD